ncbi:hypothetical protein V6260_00780 [Pseudoalteromonas aliena]|uniref:hypothetical protein n=1 Tax=Pseudoalteromonas aliena TaxID=247523 RepID=UPI00311DDFB8
MKFLLVILFSVLLLSPLLLKLYISIAPGEMIGNINGWLGFLGGYLGGLMAFLSAAVLFRQQRNEAVRPFFIINTLPIDEADGLLFFVERSDITRLHDPDLIQEFLDENRPATCLEIKNIGVGAALDISFTDTVSRGGYYYINSHQMFSDSCILGTAEVQEKQAYGIALRECVIPENTKSNVCFTLSYSDIHGKNYKQQIHIARSVGGGYGYHLLRGRTQ